MSFSYRGDDPYVFVSFAREDRTDVIDEIEHLHDLGYRVFFDDEMDEDALKGSGFVLIFVSPCTTDSDEVKAELQLASQSGKDTLAVYLDEVELHGTVGLLLGGVDDVKKYRMKEAFYRQRLEKSLGEHLRRPGVTPPAIVEKPVAATTAPARKPSAKKAASAGPSGPGLVERLKEQLAGLDSKQKGIYGAGAALALFIVIGFVYLASQSGAPPVAVSPDTPKGPTEPVLSKEEREAQQIKLKAELEKRRIEREEREKERALQEAERQKKTQASNHFLAGNNKFASGEFKEAIADYDKAISVIDDDPAYFLKRAQAKFRAKDDAGAIADYGKVIELDPERAEAYFERGSVLKYKDQDAAIADFTKALKLKADYVDALIARGDAKRMKGSKKDLKAAWIDYTGSIKIEPKYPAYYGRSLCKKKLGDKRGADKDMEKARKLGR